MKSPLKTIHLGATDDARLRDALRDTLQNRGATTIDRSWGVGGSVELETLTVRIGDECIVIEAETFEGLTLTGPPALAAELAGEILGICRT